MTERKNSLKERVLWIDHKNRIISFQKVFGFEPMRFPDRDAMLAFALDMGSSGYRLQ